MASPANAKVNANSTAKSPVEKQVNSAAKPNYLAILETDEVVQEEKVLITNHLNPMSEDEDG